MDQPSPGPSAPRAYGPLMGAREGSRKANSAEREQCARRRSQMRKHYGFSKARRNPYAQRLKRQVTIRLDTDARLHAGALAPIISI